LKKKITYLLLLFLLALLNNIGVAQNTNDSLRNKLSMVSKRDSQLNNSTVQVKNFLQKDSIKPIKKHNPKEATRRSLILPGWGQAYNKQYWKIPIVWGALSIPTVTFFYNNTIYKEARFAYEAKYKAQLVGATRMDSTDFNSLEQKYQKADINSVQSLRNAARRDRDYSIFWFLILWGLNVADATVFGHLKEFDVSENLALKIKPDFNIATKTPAINLNFALKHKVKKVAYSAR
jgi:hypothetical protein